MSQDKFRKAELAKIHIAKKDLGLDDDTYRTVLHQVAGVESAGDLDARGRKAVLDHFASLGFSNRKKRGRPHNLGKGRNSREQQLAKIEALLTIGGKSWAYADGLAKRICKVEKVAWVPDSELYKVITALRKQAQREEWDLSGE